MIHTLDQVTINGLNQIWNGYIFNVNYQPSFGQNPGYLTLNLVSEDGTYTIQDSDLQILTPFQISIGNNINLEMYPVRYELTKGGKGKLLEVRFVDTSIVLDKIIVVLNGRQGNDGSTYPIDPYGGTITYPVDGGAGSCYIPVGRELLTVNDTYNSVLQVVYTFPELIDGIGGVGITIDPDSYSLIQNSNQFYHATYIGTLRNVITQWCTDLGYGFYWENNSIHFLDLRTNLILDTSSLDSAAQEEQSMEVTIEDTVGRVGCAFYGQDREWIQLNPKQDTELSLKQISLAQVGYSSDQIAAVKAAMLGESYFYAYHFYLSFSNTFGANILAMPQCTAADTSALSQTLDDLSPATNYSQYFYSALDSNAAGANYKQYLDLTKQVGRYFYRPMTRGDARHLSDWKNIKTASWYPKDMQVANTMLAQLAAPQAKNLEELQAFLIGDPYIAPGDPSGASNPAEDPSVNSNQGYIPSAAPLPSDNDDGFLIIDIGETSWKLLEVAGDITQPGVYLNITPDSIAQYLQANNVFYNLPVPFQTRGDAMGILGSLTSLNGQSQVLALLQQGQQKQYTLQMWGVKSTTAVQSLQISLSPVLTPEDLLGPAQLFPCILTQDVLNCVPKVEVFIRSETDKTGDTVNCHSNVVKNEMNFSQISREDLLALGTIQRGFLGALRTTTGIDIVMPAVPTITNLEDAFTLFVQDLTFSKVDPTIIKKYNLPYIDLPDNYRPSIGKGLMSLTISISEKGISTQYIMGTRFMQIPSLESVRMNIEFQRGTNQSRFLPYGYVPFWFT
jgi:hypothetical protein